MKREELHFDLPAELIAQEPAEPRDHCRLMVLDRAAKSIRHEQFFDLGRFLRAGDLLVFNQSKVLPARLLGKKASGGAVEVLLLREQGSGVWSCLIGGKVAVGATVTFSSRLSAEVLPRQADASLVRFNLTGPAFLAELQTVGTMPTPPYIKKLLDNPALYQTVYARESGSSAAPTAGLHFTQALLDQLSRQGIEQAFVTLHVGLGTFQPVKTDRVEDHPIHSEWYQVDAPTWVKIKTAKAEGRRVIAVGTTSVRVLETLAQSLNPALTGETAIFITPGYEFKIVDALITNFHTPYSSLLALVYAFAGQDFMRQAYATAIAERYRFFSFGDAMFIQ